MIPAQAATDTSRAERLLRAADQLLPLGWLGFYLLLPLTGRSEEVLGSWFDQARDLEALRSVLADGSAQAIDDNFIGPAYIAAAALVHALGGLSPEDSLVALTRMSYALSIALGLVLVRVLIQRLGSAPPAASLAGQLVFVAIAFGSWTWKWSDLPWSHFFAMFVGVAYFTARLFPARFALLGSTLIGAALALLALTRTFEFAAVVVAWGIAVVVFRMLRIPESMRPRTSQLLTGAGAFIVVAGVVHLVTGKHDPFVLYSSWQQAGDPPTFSAGLVPTKLVQVFVDPCFYSHCPAGDYAARLGSIEDLWRMPVAIQLPGLFLLPLCVLAVAGLLLWSAAHRHVAARHGRELHVLVEMTVVATGIVLGYLASSVIASRQLQYGLAREFLLSATLASVVGVSLAVVALRLALSRNAWPPTTLHRLRVPPSGAVLTFGLVGVAAVLFSTDSARRYGLPQFESRHLGRFEYVADCRRSICAVALHASTPTGKTLSIPQVSTLTFECRGQKTPFTIYASNPASGVQMPAACPGPRLVTGWPLVMGLNPNSAESDGVRVRNLGSAE